MVVKVSQDKFGYGVHNGRMPVESKPFSQSEIIKEVMKDIGFDGEQFSADLAVIEDIDKIATRRVRGELTEEAAIDLAYEMGARQAVSRIVGKANIWGKIRSFFGL